MDDFFEKNRYYFLGLNDAVKKYVDSQVSGGGTEWYNLYNLKGTGGKLYTVVENLSSIMTHNPNNYRIVLLKFKKQHTDGRRWAMPMFIYELYNQGSCSSLPPNAIAENNTWWPVGNNPTPWFATTGAVLANVISLGERLTGDSSKRSWKNTRNKKMKIGVAVYKQTGKGKNRMAQMLQYCLCRTLQARYCRKISSEYDTLTTTTDCRLSEQL